MSAAPLPVPGRLDYRPAEAAASFTSRRSSAQRQQQQAAAPPARADESHQAAFPPPPPRMLSDVQHQHQQHQQYNHRRQDDSLYPSTGSSCSSPSLSLVARPEEIKGLQQPASALALSGGRPVLFWAHPSACWPFSPGEGGKRRGTKDRARGTTPPSLWEHGRWLWCSSTGPKGGRGAKSGPLARDAGAAPDLSERRAEDANLSLARPSLSRRPPRHGSADPGPVRERAAGLDVDLFCLGLSGDVSPGGEAPRYGRFGLARPDPSLARRGRFRGRAPAEPRQSVFPLFLPFLKGLSDSRLTFVGISAAAQARLPRRTLVASRRLMAPSSALRRRRRRRRRRRQRRRGARSRRRLQHLQRPLHIHERVRPCPRQPTRSRRASVGVRHQPTPGRTSGRSGRRWRRRTRSIP